MPENYNPNGYGPVFVRFMRGKIVQFSLLGEREIFGRI
jgi:hypothetical protein